MDTPKQTRGWQGGRQLAEIHSIPSFCFPKKVCFSSCPLHILWSWVKSFWQKLEWSWVAIAWIPALPGRKVSRLSWGGDPPSSAVPNASSHGGCVNPVILEGARQRALCQKGVLQTDRWPDRCWELNLRLSYLEGGLRTEVCSVWLWPQHRLWLNIANTFSSVRSWRYLSWK